MQNVENNCQTYSSLENLAVVQRSGKIDRKIPERREDMNKLKKQIIVLITKWEKNRDEIKFADEYDRVAQRELFYNAEILKDLRKLATL